MGRSQLFLLVDRLGLELPVDRASGLLPLLARISSKYHLGKKPTLSSPPSTSCTPIASNSVISIPSLGLKVTRQTGCLSACSSMHRASASESRALACTSDDVACTSALAASTVDFRNAMNRCAQSKQTRGSQAPRFPRIRRGICNVLKDCRVLNCPAGVRNPTTISCEGRHASVEHMASTSHTGTPNKKDWK